MRFIGIIIVDNNDAEELDDAIPSGSIVLSTPEVESGKWGEMIRQMNLCIIGITKKLDELCK